MTKIKSALLVPLFPLVMLAPSLVSCMPNKAQDARASQPASPSFANVDVTTLKQKLATGAYLLDVRTPPEFANGHIAGAKLLPLDELLSRLAEVPDDRTIYVICRSGNRSAQASTILTQAGRQAVNVTGGINDWLAANYEVVAQ